MDARRRALAAGGSLALAGLLWWTAASADPARPAPLDAPDAARLWEEAVTRRDAAELDASLRAIGRLLAAFPHEPRYLSFEAETLERAGRPLEAARSWELYVKSAPFPTEACPSLGKDYAAAGLADAALDAHRRCLALDPTKTDLMVYLAGALMRAGRDAEAAEVYAQAARRSPDDPDATLGAARLALKREDAASAETAVEPILKANPDNSDVLVVAAQVAFAKKDDARARTLLLHAAEVSPRYTDVFRLLLRAQNALGDAEGAAKTRRSLAELEELEKGR